MQSPALKEILHWDIHNWSPAISYWETLLQNKKELSCLELGSNQGGLSLWLASKGHQVICSDIYEPSKEVKEFHQRFSFSSRISYEVINATHIPHENKFDVVILKSVLGGVGRAGRSEDIEKAIGEIHKSLKPGGLFLFAENLKGTKLHVFFREKFVHWSKDWNYLSYKDVNPLLGKFSSHQIRTNGFLGAFGFNEGTRNFLGKADSLLFRKLPSNWHYVVYGHAVK